MPGSGQLQVIVKGLSNPGGLAFEAGDLYITNGNKSPPTAVNNTVSVFPEKAALSSGCQSPGTS